MSIRELLEINRRIRESPAYERVEKLDQLNPSLALVQGNYFELRRCIRAAEDDWNLLDIRRRQDVYDLLGEVARTLHNYSASTFSLVDHTRRFVKANLPDEGVPDLVKSEIEYRFEKDEISRFMQGLRNFILHRELPAVFLKESFDSARGSYQVLELKTKELLTFDGWNPKALAYLASSIDSVPIAVVAEEYFTKVMDFHQWLRDRAFEYYRDDLTAIEAMQQEAIPHRREHAVRFLEDALREAESSGKDPFDAMANIIDPENYRDISRQTHASLRLQEALAHLERRGGYVIPDDLKIRLAVVGDQQALNSKGTDEGRKLDG